MEGVLQKMETETCNSICEAINATTISGPGDPRLSDTITCRTGQLDGQCSGISYYVKSDNESAVILVSTSLTRECNSLGPLASMGLKLFCCRYSTINQYKQLCQSVWATMSHSPCRLPHLLFHHLSVADCCPYCCGVAHPGPDYHHPCQTYHICNGRTSSSLCS